MFLNFIALDGKVLNLNSIVFVEDQSTDDKPIALVNTLLGYEFEFTGEDATRLFDQMDIIVQVNDAAIAQAAAASQGAQP